MLLFTSLMEEVQIQHVFFFFLTSSPWGKERERGADRHRGGQTDTETQTQTQTQTDTETDRQRQTETDTETERVRKRDAQKCHGYNVCCRCTVHLLWLNTVCDGGLVVSVVSFVH